MPDASDTPRQHLLPAARLLSHPELQQWQPGRAAAVELLHMYLCRLFPARTLGVKADALNPLEAYASVPPRQGRASNSEYSARRPERSDWRHTGHPPRSSPNLELVAVTLRWGSQVSPRQPAASPARHHAPPLRRPLQVPGHWQSGSPCQGHWGGVASTGRTAGGQGRAGEEVRGAGDVMSLAASPKLRRAGFLLLAQSSPAPGAAHHLRAPTPPASAALSLRASARLPPQPANVTGKHG